MQRFECKQTAGKIKASCGKNSDEFSKIFWYVRSSCKKKRYCKKLKLIDDVDPDAIEYENLTYDMNCFPAITYSDIVNYLAFGTSSFSEEDMKADKSLDACNQVLEWWFVDVKTLLAKSNLNIVWGKVRSLHYSNLFDHFA